ncbi:MAG TPA: hypothetical protein VEY30_10355 [Myxococcaceae bacterium]|nr:hypothetical protein [Myxococcaceae bacterium]
MSNPEPDPDPILVAQHAVDDAYVSLGRVASLLKSIETVRASYAEHPRFPKKQHDEVIRRLLADYAQELGTYSECHAQLNAVYKRRPVD